MWWLVLLTAAASASRFSLYRLEAHDKAALVMLNKLQMLDHKYKIDFWKEASHVGDHADVMIDSKHARLLEHRFYAHNISFRITVPDVEKLIRRNEGGIGSTRERRLHDDPILDSEPDDDLSRVTRLRKARYPFGDYASYPTMVKFMRTLEFYYPNITKTVRLGITHEGKPIEGLLIGKPRADGSKKRVVWIDGNIHAREWASSHTALYIINQLIGGYGKDDLITHYVDNLDIIVVPCLNPDGYEYTRSSPMPNVRLWRKNRSPEKCQPSVWGGERCCQGVDLNRNFDFHWAESGSSFQPCSNIYHGDSVFSEPEARAVKDYLNSENMRGRVDAFLTLHSYAQLWIYPYSHAEMSYPEDIGQLRKTARKAIDRLQSVYGTQYRMGTGADTLTPASGGSDDWAKSTGVKYVYLVELRPEMELSNGFILHKKELIPTAVETFEGAKVVLDAVLEHNNIKRNPISRIPEILRKKQLYRMRLLSMATSTTTTPSPPPPTLHSNTATAPARIFEVTTRAESLTTRIPFVSRHLKRLKSPIIMLKTSTELTTATTTTTTPAPSTTPSSGTTRYTHSFYVNTKPLSFRDPSCRDMRYSCGFWLKANANVCVEQESFMKAQCAYTCKFCTSTLLANLEATTPMTPVR